MKNSKQVRSQGVKVNDYVEMTEGAGDVKLRIKMKLKWT